MGRSGNSGNIFLAFVAGVLVGGAMGILFAPDKGQETRRLVAGKTDDLKQSLKAKFQRNHPSGKRNV
jgi:gas vesicle protein